MIPNGSAAYGIVAGRDMGNFPNPLSGNLRSRHVIFDHETSAPFYQTASIEQTGMSAPRLPQTNDPPTLLSILLDQVRSTLIVSQHRWFGAPGRSVHKCFFRYTVVLTESCNISNGALSYTSGHLGRSVLVLDGQF